MEKRMQGGFDVLRIVLAFFVVLLHAQPRTGSALLDYMLDNCVVRIAVPLFFCMAGYFLFLKIPTTHLRRPEDQARLLNYTKRIAVLCLVWMPPYMVIVQRWSVADWWATLKVAPLRALLVNTPMLPGVFWYLFALTAAVLVHFVLGRRLRRTTLCLLSLALYVVLVLSDAYGAVIEGISVQNGIIQSILYLFAEAEFRCFWGIPFFSMGVWLAELDTRSGAALLRAERPKRIDVIGLALSLLLFAAEVYARWRLSAPPADLYVLLPAVCYFLMRVLARVWVEPKPIYPLLRNASAMVYYAHGLVLAVAWRVMRISPAVIAVFEKTPFLMAVTAFALSFAFACVVLRLERHPKFRWLKKIH